MEENDMDDLTKKKIDSCSGNDECAPDLTDGEAIVDKVRKVGVSQGLLKTPHLVTCKCYYTFSMRHFEEKCPNCNRVYGVTPCSSHNKHNIVCAGIDY